MVPPPRSAALALHRSYTHVSDALRNSIGEAGRDALLTRALACTEPAHPAVRNLHVLGHDGGSLDDIAASIETYGRDDTAAAIEALIGAVRDILTRLIGADLAMQLIDDGDRRPQPAGGAREP